jgi:adenine/guanine phosphoribosyltransferase-like PRPP-binding protein
MALDPSLAPLEDVLLVDDVVTRGATLMAAAMRILQAFPRARVRAFAVVRTFSDPGEFDRIESPSAGTIHLYASGKTHRTP